VTEEKSTRVMISSARNDCLNRNVVALARFYIYSSRCTWEKHEEHKLDHFPELGAMFMPDNIYRQVDRKTIFQHVYS